MRTLLHSFCCISKNQSRYYVLTSHFADKPIASGNLYLIALTQHEPSTPQWFRAFNQHLKGHRFNSRWETTDFFFFFCYWHYYVSTTTSHVKTLVKWLGKRDLQWSLSFSVQPAPRGQGSKSHWGRENIISSMANNSYSFTPCNSSRYSFFPDINFSLRCWYYWACRYKGHVFPRMSWQGHWSDSCWENTNYYLKVIGFCSSLINSFISGSHWF